MLSRINLVCVGGVCLLSKIKLVCSACVTHEVGPSGMCETKVSMLTGVHVPFSWVQVEKAFMNSSCG